MRNTPHRKRSQQRGWEPVHVTLRSKLSCLRAQTVFRRIKLALGIATRLNEDDFRIVEYSVQSNHIHMLVEASDNQSLSRGMRSLVVRLAKTINKLLNRRGNLWADRWHSRALENPRSVRNALRYVLLNHAKHTGREIGIDPCSSAKWFEGFKVAIRTLINAANKTKARRAPGAAIVSLDVHFLLQQRLSGGSEHRVADKLPARDPPPRRGGVIT